ncbi:MAG TPA: HNH endonuclease signature motif containing protein [Anaeromyxobacteraceae bacterium]
MADPTPASLDSTALSRRLGELAGHERQIQVEFLLHLEEFDRRRAWAEAGYPSLWEWCLRVLHLREGAAGRRIAAMRVLRRLPRLADALRDGRLSLTTVTLLGPVLTEENCEEIVARASYLTKAETEHLVVSLQPRTAPKEGLRLLSPARAVSSPSAAQPSSAAPPRETPPSHQEPSALTNPPVRGCPPERELPRPASRATLEPVSEDTYSLRVTVDTAFTKDLDQLKALLAHKFPDGELGAVLREAVQCALEKHGKRKGAVEPSRKRKGLPPSERAAGEKAQPTGRDPIPAAVRREVWKRDGGRCAWRSEDGHRCGSTWKLELDHIKPAALGGPSTVDNLRVCCRSHNQLHADHAFGRAHMELFRRGPARTGQGAIARRSGGREGGDDAPGHAGAP